MSCILTSTNITSGLIPNTMNFLEGTSPKRLGSSRQADFGPDIQENLGLALLPRKISVIFRTRLLISSINFFAMIIRSDWQHVKPNPNPTLVSSTKLHQLKSCFNSDCFVVDPIRTESPAAAVDGESDSASSGWLISVDFPHCILPTCFMYVLSIYRAVLSSFSDNSFK